MDKIIEEILSLKESDIPNYEKHLMLGGGTPGPHLVRGRGIYVEDMNGKKYIDCTSQSWALYLGFNHPEINQIVKEQLEILTHAHTGFYTLPRYVLAKRLVEITPEKLNRVMFTVGGGPAVEAALKIAIINKPEAHQFISLYDSYHGTTFMSMAASWISTMTSGEFIGGAKFAHFTQNFIRVPNPYCYRCVFDLEYPKCEIFCAKFLEETIKKGSNGPIAALILEPLQGSGGQVLFPKEYLEKVRQICDKYGIILIYDEIQTAFGRMGEWFAADYFNVDPDIIVAGKSMGAGFPISAIIISDDLKGFEMKGEDLHTFGNNQISQVAALKQLEIIKRDNILDNVKKVGNYISGEIKKMMMEFPQIGEIRGPGLHIGVELVKDPVTKEIAKKEAIQVRDEGIKLGIIFGLSGTGKNVIKIKPPLITTIEEAGKIVELFYESMSKVFKH